MYKAGKSTYPIATEKKKSALSGVTRPKFFQRTKMFRIDAMGIDRKLILS